MSSGGGGILDKPNKGYAAENYDNIQRNEGCAV